MTDPTSGHEADFCFRLRFTLSGNTSIQLAQKEVPLDTNGAVVLSGHRGETIGATRNLVVLGSGYASEEAAREAGERWRGFLERAFATSHVGADFGDRAATSVVTEHGLRWLEGNVGERVLNDVHGLMVFESKPWPRFAHQEVTASVRRAPDAVLTAIREASDLDASMSGRERVAYDLFSAALTLTSPDARFVMLMMAVEALIEEQPRPSDAVAHAEALIAATRSADIAPDEKASMLGTLEYLRQESINQAGRRLARTLGDRHYGEEPAEKFFSRCYNLRSALVHGAYPRPSQDSVRERTGQLEVFLSDLLGLALLR